MNTAPIHPWRMGIAEVARCGLSFLFFGASQMANIKKFNATLRERVGKGASRAERRNAKVPAVIYGGGEDPIAISLDYKETQKAIYSGGFKSQIAEVQIGSKKIRCIPRDYQLDRVKGFVEHVDFLRLKKGAKLTVEIPVQFINEETCPGIKAGGVLNVVRHTVECEVPADDIPEHIICDLATLELGDGLHISHVNLPENVHPTITDRDFTIATIAAPAGLKSEENASDEDESDADTDVSEE